jgi:hypothetical protein
MPHDQAYLEAEKKIQQALKPGAIGLPIQHLFFHSQSIESKGDYYGA